MKIYSWNVNGIRAIMEKGFTQWVQDEQPDILCLQETKIQPEQITEQIKGMEGYHSYFSCAERKGYSGVAVYTKQIPVSVAYGIGIERFDKEGRILIMEYPEFFVFNIYFPNGQKDEDRLAYKIEFYEALLDYCDKLKQNGSKLIICGDYNTAHKEIDLKNPKQSEKTSGFLPIERAWIDQWIQHGYIDTFRHLYPEAIKYSWWSYRFNARERGTGWRIDYHFVSDNMVASVKDADVLDHVMGSDHCPVALYL